MTKMIDETGNRHGPYKVIRRIEPNYPGNNSAMWECECVHCGARKDYIGAALRQGYFAHKCKECGGK